MSPRLVQRPGFDPARARRFLEALELRPASVVIELTEDFPAIDLRLLREALLLYRSMGFRVALDDLGEGFSSLRLWSELRPEFVKADKHFVRGIARDAVKRQFLSSIQDIARRCGTQVIAEGVEVAEDLRAVRRIGVAMAQGWFIGRPAAMLA
jgi:EAL domain-containing protein (putative c-di-GMP-specific phosphodiesterase class I)